MDNHRQFHDCCGQGGELNGVPDDLAQTQDLLRQCRERLDAVQRVANLGFWEWNIVTNDLYWSEHIYRIFGLTPQQFGATYDAFLHSVHPDDREAVQLAVDAAVSTGAEYSIDHRIVTPEGEVRYVHEEGDVTRDADGQPLRMLGTVIDITTRKRTENSFKESETKFRSLWEAAAGGMLMIDSHGTIELVNREAEALFGYAREELIGKPLEVLVPDRFRDKHVESRRDYADHPYSRKMGEGRELSVLRKDGVEVPVEISLTPVHTDDGLHVLAEVMDITRRRILESQLRQSQKLEAVGQMAGGIAHDLNNILTAMIGFSDLALIALEDRQPAEESIGEVLAAGQRAKSLIGQLLAFTRQQVLQPRVLDLNAVMRDLENMLRRLLRENVELITVLDPDLARVELDPNQFEQVIINLAINAADAMPEGGRLRISTRTVEVDGAAKRREVDLGPGRYVEVAVADTGVGMDEATKSSVFEPFFTTKGQGKGTGLGLSTVYGIVKQSGGDIVVESSLGAGSTFAIYLPTTDLPVDTEAVSPDNGSAIGHGTGTILLVEDDEGVRVLLERILQDSGYSVAVTSSGEEALASIDGMNRVDLLITDLVLPDINGVALSQNLAERQPGLPTLFISGYAGKDLEHFGHPDDDSNFLAKPFTREALLTTLSRLLH